jgi:hypothetical protein
VKDLSALVSTDKNERLHAPQKLMSFRGQALDQLPAANKLGIDATKKLVGKGFNR